MSLRQATDAFQNHLISRRVAVRFAADADASWLKSQMSAMAKKIDQFDAGATGKAMQRYTNEITQLGLKLEKRLEKLDGKLDDKKLNRAIEHAMAFGGYGDKLLDAEGDPVKVDKLLGGAQDELKDALKLLM